MRCQHLYKELANRIKVKILSGEYKPGEKLPSIRLIAKKEHITPNTVHNALRLLVETELIVPKRTFGYFVIEDYKRIKDLHKEECNLIIKKLRNDLNKIGIDKYEIISLLINYC